MEDLTLLLRQPPHRERADAASNRLAALDAAARLFARHGVDHVSMDAIAAEAGVGKGTLFRRFGDKAGLAYALLDARERTLQEAILSGPPPLGPGAAPGERLQAFVDAYFSYVIEHLDLVNMSENASPGARYRIGAYRFWHRHTAILLAAAGEPEGGPGNGPESDAGSGPSSNPDSNPGSNQGNGPGSDPDSLAHIVLAALAANHLKAVTAEHGADRTRAGLCDLVRRLTSSSGCNKHDSL